MTRPRKSWWRYLSADRPRLRLTFIYAVLMLYAARDATRDHGWWVAWDLVCIGVLNWAAAAEYRRHRIEHGRAHSALSEWRQHRRIGLGRLPRPINTVALRIWTAPTEPKVTAFLNEFDQLRIAKGDTGWGRHVPGLAKVDGPRSSQPPWAMVSPDGADLFYPDNMEDAEVFAADHGAVPVDEAAWSAHWAAQGYNFKAIPSDIDPGLRPTLWHGFIRLANSIRRAPEDTDG